MARYQSRALSILLAAGQWDRINTYSCVERCKGSPDQSRPRVAGFGLFSASTFVFAGSTAPAG
jgi:hypothetical protein